MGFFNIHYETENIKECKKFFEKQYVDNKIRIFNKGHKLEVTN